MATKINQCDEIKFFLQNVERTVKLDDINPSTSLNHFIRDKLNLKGTKGMCYEGGCGACLVVVESKDQITQNPVYMAVNSCLVPVLSCDGLRIHTIEGIGNPISGYHPVQNVLADYNGTQCGFCSPGMVMNMYALYQSGKLTQKEVENSFGGNICRCTGYRPILAAFKSLCKDTNSEDIHDIEDIKTCERECTSKCKESCPNKIPFYHSFGQSKWFKVFTMETLLNTLKSYTDSSYMLVAGNTAQANLEGRKISIMGINCEIRQAIRFSEGTHSEHVMGSPSMRVYRSFSPFNTRFTYNRSVLISKLAKYKLDDLYTYCGLYLWIPNGTVQTGVFKSFKHNFDLYIDINGVTELKNYSVKDSTLILGANNSLTATMEILSKVANEQAGFAYLKKLVDHIDLIANVPVRNTGTLAGNLIMKTQYLSFPSDIFLIFETVGATITIADLDNVRVTKKLTEFIYASQIELHKIITSINLPALPSNVKYESYKIMPRAQNAHAIVNAGFLFDLDGNNVVNSARIVYGNINISFVHATKTENVLKGKPLFDNATIQSACYALRNEVNAETIPGEPSPEYRKQLAISLFYKTLLSMAPVHIVSPINESGGAKLERPISSGVEDYDTNTDLYPLTKAMPKIEALAQTSGQAEFIGDMPDLPHQLYAAFVLAEAAPKSKITNIDYSEALKVEDVVACYGAADIPGDNNFTPLSIFAQKEEIFCTGEVLYHQQPIGIVVGTNSGNVHKAANLVTVTYDSPSEIPYLTSRQVLQAGKTDRIHLDKTIVAKDKGTDIKEVVKGSFDIYQQYHFHMETQCCNVIPTEDGLDVYPSSQWMDLIQIAIANMLKIPNSKVHVKVRRCGGAFGAKISRNTLIACAAALAAWKQRRPVKLVLSLPTNMNIIGKRWPLSVDYEVGVNGNGLIQYLSAKQYIDRGVASNETGINEMINLFMGAYDSDRFGFDITSIRTDTCANTWTRAPGTTEGLAAIEAIMEHIAYSLNLDPLQVRTNNIGKQAELLLYIDHLKEWADIDGRKQTVESFNKANRWKKKGLAVVPMAYKFSVFGPYTTTISVYHGDGSVSICHGGIEVGQGVNTKAVQVCSYKLGVPLEKITVLPSQSYISPNCAPTGGSVTSEAVCFGVLKACEDLLDRMKPVKAKMNQPTWEQLVQKCYDQGVRLTASGMYSVHEPDLKDYTIFGVCATEVLLDVLTGQYQLVRVDLLEDVGVSLSPQIDIGQVEGAFVMGLGYHTSEQIIYDSGGKLLTNNTWTYKPPGAKDIPIDFRVKFPKNQKNPAGVLNSKAMAEPPLCLTICVPLALRNAAASARTDANQTVKWYPINGPTTLENIYLNCATDYQQYKL